MHKQMNVKSILQAALQKTCWKSEAPRGTEPREQLMRPNHQADMTQFFCCFFSSDHGGMSTVVAQAAPAPRSGN
jgi:hypothetical protein